MITCIFLGPVSKAGKAAGRNYSFQYDVFFLFKSGYEHLYQPQLASTPEFTAEINGIVLICHNIFCHLVSIQKV